jgi:hypothetical protein
MISIVSETVIGRYRTSFLSLTQTDPEEGVGADGKKNSRMGQLFNGRCHGV